MSDNERIVHMYQIMYNCQLCTERTQYIKYCCHSKNNIPEYFEKSKGKLHDLCYEFKLCQLCFDCHKETKICYGCMNNQRMPRSLLCELCYEQQNFVATMAVIEKYKIEGARNLRFPSP